MIISDCKKKLFENKWSLLKVFWK